MNIRDTIVTKRKLDIKKDGYSQGLSLPEARNLPLYPFNADKRIVLCEIKKASPSKGDISREMNPVTQAGLYVYKGVKCISVLTEQNYFKGSLADLMAIKKAYPKASILRKDFLIDEEDIRVSHRVGADAVLLIASILSEDSLVSMYKLSRELGMTPLVEIHSSDDIRKAAKIEPEFTGINSRDLKTFTIDPLLPLKKAAGINWKTSLVYESGITTSQNARFAFDAGFKGILVGESVVRDPRLVPLLLKEAKKEPEPHFYGKLFSKKRASPLVKICGLSCNEDVALVDRQGADLLGFILSESPRRITTDFIRKLPKTKALKVAVVVPDAEGLIPVDIFRLLENDFIDGVQLHGKASPGVIHELGFNAYSVLKPNSVEEVVSHGPFPRILYDKKSRKAKGGTGKLIEDPILTQLDKNGPYWLAGGLDPFNIKSILEHHSPELVDASSKLELYPGKKDPVLIEAFFKEIHDVQ